MSPQSAPERGRAEPPAWAQAPAYTVVLWSPGVLFTRAPALGHVGAKVELCAPCTGHRKPTLATARPTALPRDISWSPAWAQALRGAPGDAVCLLGAALQLRSRRVRINTRPSSRTALGPGSQAPRSQLALDKPPLPRPHPCILGTAGIAPRGGWSLAPPQGQLLGHPAYWGKLTEMATLTPWAWKTGFHSILAQIPR